MSTMANYNCKWKVYASWCHRRKIHPFAPSLPKLLDFFSYLKNKKTLSLSAFLVYRSALMPIFKLAGENYESSIELKLLFKAFKKDAPKRGLKPPLWDVNVVLISLKNKPFEPFNSCTVKDATLKTLFLIALATAHRVGEL